ncbi:amidohydrolase family protein [Streptomyces sp. NBC_01320]|uniref:amidohydrolase family protein n=1 Tax=Streptomyces sp. NBC_01320 TaxID=2903824 RepID=UPI002E13D48E|nr:amidohydrolase family protein [Streptomyces sp. NBC_01320]
MGPRSRREQVPELVARWKELTFRRFRAGSVKITQDGSPKPAPPFCSSRTSTPSAAPPPASAPASSTRRTAPVRHALGFQTHVHALGDRAVREALDAVEAARTANGRTDTRPHLARLRIVHPDGIARFRELGATTWRPDPPAGGPRGTFGGGHPPARHRAAAAGTPTHRVRLFVFDLRMSVERQRSRDRHEIGRPRYGAAGARGHRTGKERAGTGRDDRDPGPRSR